MELKKSKLSALKKNKYLWFGISLIILLGMVYISDVSKFVEALRSANPYYLIPALGLGLSGFLIWGYVWHMFFRHMDFDLKYQRTMEMFMAGNFLNSITPLGQFGGEPFMAYIVSRNTDASYDKSLSCVISADIINAIPFLTFLTAGAAYMFLFQSVKGLVAQAAYLAIIFALIGGLIAYLLWFDEEILEKYLFVILNRIQSRIGRGEKFIQRIKERISSTKAAFYKAGDDPRMLLEAATLTHATFLLQIASLYFILLSLSITPNFPAIYFTVMLSGVATFSPTPGGSGTFEAAFAGILMLFYPLNFAIALTAAVLFRLTTYWPGLIIGYLAFIKLNTPDREQA
ncbi:lysylphosphatidylglycerol synthase transmembrane domain-containing protein [Candidatus Nanosalina sp. VS9-1]|uniref:lysylphosphatidylglycerol synthase transmembrane domain-containing protein n=1 Tax=Candidatus Nanosalina sp. VS9-1 TaxID=3388566 RepID=UPI0039DF7EF8